MKYIYDGRVIDTAKYRSNRSTGNMGGTYVKGRGGNIRYWTCDVCKQIGYSNEPHHHGSGRRKWYHESCWEGLFI